MSGLLSKQFVHDFLQIKDCIKREQILYRKGRSSCQLCYNKGKRGHSEWNCPRYKDPASVRQYLISQDLCRACGIPSQLHDEGCCRKRILIFNRGDKCRRCGGIDHLFWTCDGGPHPGSQFKETIDKDAQDIRGGKNCKNLEILEQSDLNKGVEKDIGSNLKNNSQTPNTSKSDLQSFEDKIVKTFENMLNKQKESIMVEIKTMHRAFPQNSAESETPIKCQCKDSSEERKSTGYTLKSKDEEITCLKNYISQYEQKNVDNEKTISDMRRRFRQVQKENEENESQVYSLKHQLDTNKSRIVNLQEQSTALKQENKKLKEAVSN